MKGNVDKLWRAWVGTDDKYMGYLMHTKESSLTPGKNKRPFRKGKESKFTIKAQT